jgi:hypothetical protein
MSDVHLVVKLDAWRAGRTVARMVARKVVVSVAPKAPHWVVRMAYE